MLTMNDQRARSGIPVDVVFGNGTETGDYEIPTCNGRLSRLVRADVLLVCDLQLDLLDDQRRRSSALIDLARRRDFLSCKGQQLLVLSTRGRGRSDRPVDRTVVAKDDQWRAAFARAMALSRLIGFFKSLVNAQAESRT